MRFVDSHLHVGVQEVPRTLSLARATQTLLVVCGVDRASSLAALHLAEESPGSVRPFVGVHPSEAGRERDLAWLPTALARASGLGEVGLDPGYSEIGQKSPQMTALVDQLELAQSGAKPVQVHSRNAERECLEILSGFRLKSVVMHWLQDETVLPAVLERGYFVSFGPALLYSKKLQRMAARCGPDQALAETDSPVAFVPLGGVSGPVLVPSVIFKLAEIWGRPFEDAREAVAGNAGTFLGVPKKG